MGSGSEEHDDLAHPLGELLARLGVNLLTGGGCGVMTAVSRAYTRSLRTAGLSIGILPCADVGNRARPKDGYPNPHVELPIFTHLSPKGTPPADLMSRNHINILNSDLVVALPGGPGTASEVQLAIDYNRPVILFAEDPDRFAHLPVEVARVRSIEEVSRWIERLRAS
jgi:uncharacterized protein (TIGR00725 family)